MPPKYEVDLFIQPAAGQVLQGQTHLPSTGVWAILLGPVCVQSYLVRGYCVIEAVVYAASICPLALEQELLSNSSLSFPGLKEPGVPIWQN